MKRTFTKCLAMLALCFVGINSAVAQWINNQAADAVYGQTDFNSVTQGNSQEGNKFLVKPVSVAFTKNSKKVIVAAVTSNVTSALYVYNNYAESTNANTNSLSKLALPFFSTQSAVVNSIFVDEADNLWIALNGDGDINLYKYPNASNLSSLVSGYYYYKIKNYGTNTVRFKGSIFVKSGVLVVADAINHVVARYDVSNPTNTANLINLNPIAIIGEVGTSGFYKADQSKVLLNTPVQVSIDHNNALWIADKNNNRVLKYDDGLTFTNASTPSLTIGKTNHTVTTNDNTANNFTNYTLTGIATDGGGRLYAALTTTTGSVVSIYNTNTITSNLDANATNVIGTTSLTPTFPNHSNPNNGATKLFNTSNIFIHDNYLWVTDYDWHRVTRFEASSTLPVTLTDLKATKADGMVNLTWKTSSETNNSHYIVSTSYDGKTFNKVKHVDAKNAASDYSVSFPIETVLYAGFGLLGLLLIPRQRNKWVKMFVIVLAASFLAACAKETIEAEVVEKDVVYVKLEQVDFDGTVTELGVKSIKIK